MPLKVAVFEAVLHCICRDVRLTCRKGHQKERSRLLEEMTIHQRMVTMQEKIKNKLLLFSLF
jgi:hypothetical protein